MKIIILMLLFYSGLVFGQQFNLTDVRGSYYTIDRFANEVYYLSPWIGGLIQKINLITKEVEDTQLSGLPVFFHNTHKAIYQEITDSSNIYYLRDFGLDSTKKLYEIKFSSKNLLKTNFIFLPWHKISPDDKKLFLGSVFFIEDSTRIISSESFFNYAESETGFIWSSDSSVIFKSVENSIAEYNIYSQNIDTLVSLEIDNPITGFDYNLSRNLLAYSTGEGFLHEKLFIFNRYSNTYNLIYNPTQDDPDYYCGNGWMQYDELKWSPDGNYLTFFGYTYTNPGTGINVYDNTTQKIIPITECVHYGLKRNPQWVNNDSILYIREDTEDLCGYDLHTKLTSIKDDHCNLYQLTISNYPNPFNPETTIKYSLPIIASNFSLRNVKLKVYDILGREVTTLVNKEQKPGEYEVNWKPINGKKNVSSGIYIIRLEINNGSERINKLRKILYLK